MKSMKKISSGAESTIFLDKNKITKNRFSKNYRIKEIDSRLRKSRTRTEAKILQKISVKAPKLFKTDREEIIEMEYIEGDKIRDGIDNKPKLAEEIGVIIAKIHDEEIIHGDLTTSNMILRKEDKKIYLIDLDCHISPKKLKIKQLIYIYSNKLLKANITKYGKKLTKTFLKAIKKSKTIKK